MSRSEADHELSASTVRSRAGRGDRGRTRASLASGAYRVDDPARELNPYAPPKTERWRTCAEGELAERTTRLGAYLLDSLVLFASAIPLVFILTLSIAERAAKRGGFSVDSTSGLAFEALVGALVGPIPLTLYQWYLIATRGQTLGKKWTGIKIVKSDGSPVDFTSGVLRRNWLLSIPSVIPTFGGGLSVIISLIDPLMILGDGRRCLHDLIADTKVIVAPGEPVQGGFMQTRGASGRAPDDASPSTAQLVIDVTRR